jgi:carboxypeptidase Taq
MCFEGKKRTQILLRKDYDNFFSAVMDAVHEAGHALYRINMCDEVRESMMGLIETDYAGMDEAMAMLFDQNLALTPQFALYLTKVIKEETAHEISSYYDAHTIYKGLNAAPFGLTRVQAGPEQYGLFMAQYGELERDLMLQRITPEQLPDEWQALANDWHGIYPQEGNTKESVFQDPHWSLGEIGRFSGGYLPGSLMAAQIYDALIAGQPQIMNAVQNGNFAPFIQLCREKLYYQPRRAHYNDFMKAATGQELKADSFLNKAKDDIEYIWQSARLTKAPLFKPNS